ncbi:SLATT domain-containing protein [Aeromonas caviae]
MEGQLRECFGRVVYSHKTHEKCADILLKRLSTVKLWQIILSALTTGGFIAAVFGAGDVGALVGIVISTVLLVLNAYTKNYDLGELAQKHRQAGADLWIIREKYLSLITDLRMGEKPLESLQTERDVLLEQLHAVYSGAPSTTYEAYKKAQEALQQLEDMTFSDAEIDAFLPKELKRG